jgi:hypothetical protein
VIRAFVLTALLLLPYGAVAFSAPLDPSSFAYDNSVALKVTYGSSATKDGVSLREVSFESTTRHTITGVLVPGVGKGPFAPVLWVHWLGDPPTTNHTEFESDAIALAKRGVTSLLIDAMWSQPHWFNKVRSTETDYRDSIAQVVDLRRSLDVLLAQPNVDSSRLAYVGHDFGSMYGAVLAGVDPRPQWYVLLAGTTTFSEWYLLGKKPKNVDAYVAQMAPLDPLPYLTRAKAKGYLFQFSSHDEYVTNEKELQYFGAAPLPRGMFVYDVDHSMATQAATRDRIAWLTDKLGLR